MRYLKLVVVFLAAAGSLLVGCKKRLPAWTIMAYYDGNCDLDISRNGNSWVVAEAQEAEQVGSTDQVQMIAMVGSVRLGGNCKYYRIEKHLNELPDSLKSTVLEVLGTKDMSDKATLRNFIQYCVTNYPAQHYMLMIKNHGGGWRGACLDQQNGAGAMMSLPEFREALDTFHFDIIAFDACLMGMCEVAYELRGKADYLVASQFVTYAGTYGSAEWLGWLTANPNAGGLDLGKKIVEACMHANEAHQFTGQQAVIDLSQMDALASRVGTLGNELVTASGQYAGEILDAFARTHSTELDDPAFCDLREFCKNVLQEPHLKEIPQIKTATENVISAINSAVPMTMTNAVGISRGGLCIHFPYADTLFDSANYVKCQWRSTNWHSFLSKFIRAVGGGGGGGGDRGWISINSNPQGATIWYDGNNTGATTPAVLGNVLAGVHRIKLTLTGYQDWEQDVNVTANCTTYVNATLVQQGGGNRLTVSGTVTWPGHSLSNHCIAFLDTARTGAPRVMGITPVNPANGSYTIQIDLSAPVQAYVEAFDDINNNGYIEAGEGFGYWDANGNGQWDDYLTFQPGQTVQNANIVLFTVSKDGVPGTKPVE
ncbi:MAG: clostripain-related cysteine peptidase [candidate division WOR-3 bacterium]